MAIMLSPDESKVFTFSTNPTGGGATRQECRHDIWDVTGVTLAAASAASPYNYYRKGTIAISFRMCRFPGILKDDTGWILLMMTEYYTTNRTGLMRHKMDASYLGTGNDFEHSTLNPAYKFVFKSAYYALGTSTPTADFVIAYAMAVNTLDSMNYLVKYDWSSNNDAMWVYPLKGWSEAPNVSSPYVGNAHLDSIIYA